MVSDWGSSMSSHQDDDKASTLADLRARAKVVRGARAAELRAAYIERFVNVHSEYYQRSVAVVRQYVDGSYYSGYLWDSMMDHASRISTKDASGAIVPDAQVYVLWDLHSSEKILISDYWKFPRDAVLGLAFRDLLAGMRFLPEDIYVFDDSFEWSLTYTHEYDDDQQRYVFWVQPLGSGKASEVGAAEQSLS